MKTQTTRCSYCHAAITIPGGESDLGELCVDCARLRNTRRRTDRSQATSAATGGAASAAAASSGTASSGASSGTASAGASPTVDPRDAALHAAIADTLQNEGRWTEGDLAFADEPSAGPTGWIRYFAHDIHDWCQGRWWQLRVPLLFFFAWVWLQHSTNPEYQSVFKGLNLGIHELGHYVFAPFGDRMAAWGGSLLQCLVPLVGMAMFLKQRDYFAIAFAWGWLATNYFEVAPYVADAVKMQLPLVTPGGGHAIHDWNYLLGDLGWLRHTESLATLHWSIGHLCMLVCLAAMGYLLAEMMRSHARRHRAGAAA